MYRQTTRNVTVSVEPRYLDGESAPEKGVYVWSYTVRIENRSDETVQLRARHWKITDAYGRVQEVQGPGVVGEQPVLRPGESFEYTSGTPLGTASGFMAGSYSMQTPDGGFFDVDVPAFSLDTPHAQHRIH